ncbi:MAG: hypothetical protein ACE37H_16545 [Phycisphaeraceae bacterium]
MGWLKYALLGDLGSRLDLDETDRQLKRQRTSARRRRAAQHDRDEGQDERIYTLEKENDEIKLLLMELMSTLARRGALSRQDTSEILTRVEAVLPDEPDEGNEDDPLSDLADAVR